MPNKVRSLEYWSLPMSYSRCKIIYLIKRQDLLHQTLLEKANKEVAAKLSLRLGTKMIVKDRKTHGRTTCSQCRPTLLTISLSLKILRCMITCYPLLTRSSASRWWTGSLSTGTPTRLSGISTEVSRSILMEAPCTIHRLEVWPLHCSLRWTSTRGRALPSRPEWAYIVSLASSQELSQPTCQVVEPLQVPRLMLTSAIISNKILLSSNSKWKPP